MMANRMHMQALRRASDILGGSPQLRGYLKVSAFALGLWMSGQAPPPTEIFLKIVDLIVERDVSDLKSRH
jgi:hypothetical protein